MQYTRQLSLILSLAAATASDPTARDVAEQTPRTAFVEEHGRRLQEGYSFSYSYSDTDDWWDDEDFDHLCAVRDDGRYWLDSDVKYCGSCDPDCIENGCTNCDTSRYEGWVVCDEELEGYPYDRCCLSNAQIEDRACKCPVWPGDPKCGTEFYQPALPDGVVDLGRQGGHCSFRGYTIWNDDDDTTNWDEGRVDTYTATPEACWAACEEKYGPEIIASAFKRPTSAIQTPTCKCHTRCECRRGNYQEYYIIAREGRYDGLKDWCESPKTGFRPDRDQGVYPDEHPRYSKDDDRLGELPAYRPSPLPTKNLKPSGYAPTYKPTMRPINDACDDDRDIDDCDENDDDCVTVCEDSATWRYENDPTKGCEHIASDPAKRARRCASRLGRGESSWNPDSISYAHDACRKTCDEWCSDCA